MINYLYNVLFYSAGVNIFARYRTLPAQIEMEVADKEGKGAQLSK